MQKNNSLHSSNLLIALLSTCLASFGCSKVSSDDSNSNPQEVAEVDLCTTSTTYSPSATINGTATFSKRGLSTTLNSGRVESFKLGGLVTGIPIRFAEVRVLSAAGTVVQCGKTDSSGALKALDGSSDLQIPSTAGTYTVEVLSRTNYNPTVPGGKPAFNVLFSVKESIYSNSLYKTTALVTTSGAGTYNNVNSNATAAEGISAKVEGGAFNIYNDIITSYEYLANNTGTQNISCLNPKMSVYWKAGFNPAQYIYPDSDPGDLGTISFYIRTDNELYISGGRLGNVSSEDTDHFDDSVIIHELGHHVENVCGAMDSPGGSHSGAARIDPRLAWSEAWGNFFGAHIIRNNTSAINPNLAAALPSGEWLYYVDTQGYTDAGSTSGYEYLKFNLARVGNSNTGEDIYDGPGSPNYYEFDRVNSTSNPGEGHFREVAIARGLFKSTNSCSSPFANCANQNNFSDIWRSFEKYTTGMGQSTYPFRSSIRLLERLKAAKGGTLSAGLLTIFETDEAMQLSGNSAYVTGGYTTWVPYGIKLVPSGVACNLKIIPKSNISYKSDQRFSNHFYYIDKSALPSVTSIKTTNTNVDIILLPEGYRYNEDCNSSTCSKSTSGAIAADRTGSPERNMSLAALPVSSKAILNVRSYVTGSVTPGTEYIYQLTDQNGGFLCPSNSF
jgi:hypothetical protein